MARTRKATPGQLSLFGDDNITALAAAAATAPPVLVPAPAPPPDQAEPPAGFRPAGQEDLGHGGPVERIRANLAALAAWHYCTTEGRRASPAEQAILARWSGWGAVPELFDPRNAEKFAWALDQLGLYLDAEGIAAARRSTLNAHYTDAALVKAIWGGVAALGFTGGRVLEPGCGSGNFIGLAPDGAQMTGVELEPVTAGIAALLYPKAEIRAEDFSRARMGDGTFDAVIGNVPFAKITLADDRYNRGGHTIHNHFLIKALHLLRPGGVLIAVTSRYTLDSETGAARDEMAALADLLGAVRLPAGAHQAAAGTKAITDVLVLRRRMPGEDPAGQWPGVRKQAIRDAELAVSTWWDRHPGRVLGLLSTGLGQYGPELDVAPRPNQDTAAELAAALADIAEEARLAGRGWQPAPRAAWQDTRQPTTEEDGFLKPDGEGFLVAEDGYFYSHRVPEKQAPELRLLLALRDTARTLLAAQAATAEDTPQIAALQAQLRETYATYAAEYGCLNRHKMVPTGRVDGNGEPTYRRLRPGRGKFGGDPYAPLVDALELYDEETRTAQPAPIFTTRILGPRPYATEAASPEDALAVCLDTHGRVRLDEIARLLGCALDEARARLGALVFEAPPAPPVDTEGDGKGRDECETPGELVPAAAYLSGRVRAKLERAKWAALEDPAFAANVAALEAVIPEDLGPTEITAKLGSPWIDAQHVQQFLRETLADRSVRVEHPGGAMWTVRRGDRKSVAATVTWGTSRADALWLTGKLLESKPIQIRDEIEGGGTVLNLEDTVAAQEKAAALNERFTAWLWEDPVRALKLIRVYNDVFNGIVLRNYDGVRLSLPGLASWFTPHPHQHAAVARIIAEPAVLLAHAVGAGKTAEMIAGVMEMRRLGLVRKPIIAVPNHMLEQFAREWMLLYPQAKILAAGAEDLVSKKRRRMIARMATGDWDAVIITHSGLGSIPMSARVQREYMRAEVARLEDWLRQLDGDDRLSVKRIEAAILKAEERVERRLAGRRDAGVTFEETGCDYLVVDEAHLFKNLATFSSIADAAIEGSARATNLHMICEWLRARHPARHLTFATATPVANSITETHVMTRYLRPDLLEFAGILDFDAWVGAFAEVVSTIELAPEGGDNFRMKDRLARFGNVPELMRMWFVFADVKTAEDLHLPGVPLIAADPDGRHQAQVIVTEPTPGQLAYIADLGERAEKVRSRMVEPKEDNMLAISTDGRKAALDLRLVGLEQDGPGKLDAAAGNIADIYHQRKHDTYGDSDVRGSLQIVFCDLGTPHPGREWTAYDYLFMELTARGVPASRIRFIHEAKTDRAKASLFAACRAGRVSVLLGSTQMMGVGVNVQDRCVALHHIDAPWRPADVEQRDGRAVRQGNLNAVVAIYRYVVERSFDGFMWQALARKAAFIAQLMRGRLDVREMEDIGDGALSYAEVKALATGNPLLMEAAQAGADVARLERGERSHYRGVESLRWRMKAAEESIGDSRADVAAIDAALAAREDTAGDAFTMTVDRCTYIKRPAAAGALTRSLLAACEALAAQYPWPERSVTGDWAEAGRLAGFPVEVRPGCAVGLKEPWWHVDVRLAGCPRATAHYGVSGLEDMDGRGRLGLVNQLENMPARLEGMRETALAQIARDEKVIDDGVPELTVPYAKAAELATARARLAAVEAQMAALARQAQQAPEAQPQAA